MTGSPFPPPGSPPPGNLPALFTGFVGREDELAAVQGLLRSARLVTLTGPGGVGKTRLALEAAGAAADRFPDGVWLVELTPVQDPAAVAAATATALGLPDSGARPLPDQLAAYLAGRRALLLLDNCEYLTDACAALARTLLCAAPGLRVLATSRRALGVTGEHLFTVPTLTPETAVELLRERAGALGAGARCAGAERLCAGLDGLPLAIELAAARLRTLTADEVADRLTDRFRLLTGGCSTAPPHQRTLRRTIAWSYDLCTPAERLLWNRLSVFRGGFALDAAEGVCAGDGVDGAEVLDLLDRLVAQSVVLTTEVEGVLRYRLLESVRRYGRERLALAGEEQALLARHRGFFLELAERVDRDWYGPGQVRALARLRADHTNLLAALRRDGCPRARLALAAALSFHWSVGGFLTEGRRQLERALAAAPEPTRERARALFAVVWLAQTQGDLATADAWLAEAEELGRRLADPRSRAQAIGFRGVSAHYRGRPRESVAQYGWAHAIHAARGDERQATSWLLALASVQAYAGHPRAQESCGRLLAAFEASGERWGRAQVLLALGHHAWARGDRAEAGALARRALENMAGFDDRPMVALMLELLAWSAGAAGEHTRAAGLLGAAEALRRRADTSVGAFGPETAERHRHCAQTAARALGPQRYARALAEGDRYDSCGQAIAHALAPAVSDAPCGAGPLTRREHEVARLVAEGLSNREIASRLARSPRTVDGHIENVLAKLGFRGRAQIASWWTANQSRATGTTP